MNYLYPSSVARNAAAILMQLAGRLVAIYLSATDLEPVRRILAVCYPPPQAHRPAGSNLLIIWDAGAGARLSIDLEQVTHINAGGKTYHVQFRAPAENRPAKHPRRCYRWRQVVA